MVSAGITRMPAMILGNSRGVMGERTRLSSATLCSVTRIVPTSPAYRPALPSTCWAGRRPHRPKYRTRSSAPVTAAMARPWAVCCVTMPRSSTPRAPKLKNAQPFTRKVLAWYARAGRDLPWRRTRDPYRVLVSEFMLQQTQVSRVREYYPRFLARFPDLDTLARAPARAVREAWDGLGYYARARNAHELAKCVTRRDAEKGVTGKGVAELPNDPAELIKLPGIGPYTAG